MVKKLCCDRAVPLAPARVVHADPGRPRIRALLDHDPREGVLRLDLADVDAGPAADWSFPDACGHVLVAAEHSRGIGAFELPPERYALGPGAAALAASRSTCALRWHGVATGTSCILHLAYRTRNAGTSRWQLATAPAAVQDLGGLKLALLFGALDGHELRGIAADETTVVRLEQPAGYAAALPVPADGIGLLWVHAGRVRFGPRGADRTLSTGGIGRVDGGRGKGYIEVEPLHGTATWTFVATGVA